MIVTTRQYLSKDAANEIADIQASRLGAGLLRIDSAVHSDLIKMLGISAEKLQDKIALPIEVLDDLANGADETDDFWECIYNRNETLPRSDWRPKTTPQPQPEAIISRE
jgi:hypothetical protein